MTFNNFIDTALLLAGMAFCYGMGLYVGGSEHNAGWVPFALLAVCVVIYRL